MPPVVQDMRFEKANVTGININSMGTLAGYAHIERQHLTGIMVANGSVTL
jgi:mucin-19